MFSDPPLSTARASAQFLLQLCRGARGDGQSLENALSAAEEQPLAFHKGERQRPGTGRLVTSSA